MELLALVIFNMVLGFVFYLIIKIKINETLKDFQTQKLKKEIQAQTLQFYKESENYLALMDAKINALKNLLDRAEKLGINFENLENNSEKTVQQKEKKEEITQTTKPSKIAVKSNNKQFESIQLVQNLEEGFLSSVGRAFRSVLGIKETPLENTYKEETKLTKPISKVIPKNKIDFSIDGNPFEEIQTLKNNGNTSEFYSLLSDTNSKLPKVQDEAKISVQAALQELPANSTKVEKVIFLLKKGYTHAEISEELGLALPEIALIETIHIEKTKRF